MKPDSVVQVAGKMWVLDNDMMVCHGTMKRGNGTLLCTFFLIRWLACASLHHGDEAAEAMAKLLELPTAYIKVPFSIPPRKDRVEDQDELGRRHIAVLLVRALQANLS